MNWDNIHFQHFSAPGLSANDAMQKLAVLGTMADVGGGGIGKIPLSKKMLKHLNK